jgi:4-hydroxy-tetrahydrodipicolinate synthase
VRGVAINLGGLVVSLLTPMNNDYEVDFFGLKNIIARLLNKGVQNFFILGDYSEKVFFDYDIQKEIIVNSSKEINGKGNLIVGCFSDSVDSIIEKVKFAEKYADFCIVNVPYSAITNELEFIDFFDNLFTRTKAKIILYNNPFAFKRNIPIVGLNRIVGWERLVALFDFSKNKIYFKAVSEYRQSIKVFQCSEQLVFESFNYNCSGIVSGFANIYPELFLNIKNQIESLGYNNLLRQEAFFLNLLEKIPGGKEIQFYKKILFTEGIIQEYFSKGLLELNEFEIKLVENMVKKISV